MTQDNLLVGTWSLVSFQLQLTDGSVKHPWGRNLVGQVMYTPDGFMAGTFMKQDRAHFPAADVMLATPEESVAALKSYVGYAGSYSVRGDSVVHHVTVSWFPNWSGTDIERFFEVENGNLVLRTPPIAIGGMRAKSVGVWRKIANRKI